MFTDQICIGLRYVDLVRGVMNLSAMAMQS